MQKNSKKHAKFGSPSGLYALEECPGKIAFGRDIPEPEESPYAREGTVFHEVMEVLAPSMLQGITVRFPKIPDEYEDMQEHVNVALAQLKSAYLRFQENHEEVQVHYELRIKVNDDIFGTSDVVFVGRHRKTRKWNVVCIDYKYGMGVPVSAEENLQGIAYGLGAINTLKLTNVGVCMIMIAQVRLDPEWLDNPKSRYSFEGDEIGMYLKKIEAIVQKAKDIYEGKLPIELKAGTHCRFCKCSAVCPERKKTAFDELTISAEELPIEEKVKKLTLDEQVAVFLRKSEIEDFLNAVAKNLTAAMETGIVHEGVKLIRKEGRRGWDKSIEEKKLVAALKKAGIKDPYNKKLIGITDATKLAKKKKDLEKLITKGEGRVELVPSSHKAAAIAVSGAEELPE